MVKANELGRRVFFAFGLLVAMVLPSTLCAQAAGEQGEIRMARPFVDDLVRSVLPVQVDLPQPFSETAFAGERTARLAELRYCGASERGVGRFRAVVLQNTVGQAQSILAIEGSCDAALLDLAKPAAMLVEQGQSLVIAEVEVVAKKGELGVAVERAVLVRGGRKGSTELFDRRIELPAVTMAGLPIDLGGSALFLQGVPTFADGNVWYAVALRAKSSERARAVEHRAGAPEEKTALAAEMSLPMANAILHRLSAAQPIAIALDTDQIELRNISIAGKGRGADAKVTVSGTATPRSLAETVDWTLRLAGAPLQVLSVEAAARVEDCSGLASLAAVACNLRNGARVGAAQAFAAALTNRYGGRLVHELVNPLDVRFSVAGYRLHVRGDVLRVLFGQSGISAAGNVSAVVEQ